MGFGFQALSNATRVQVDQDFIAPRLIASGHADLYFDGSYGVNTADVVVTLPYDIYIEPPIVLIRPDQADKYVGGIIFGKAADWTTLPAGNGGFKLVGQCAFDYAIFAAAGTAASDGSSHGLEVYRGDGSLAYSSRHSHPRVRALLHKVATAAADGGYPNVFGISGFSQMPWLLANPLIVTAWGVGPDGEHMGCVMGAVDSTFTHATFDLRDYASPAYPRLTGAMVGGAVNDFNPYHNLPAHFAVGTFA